MLENKNSLIEYSFSYDLISCKIIIIDKIGISDNLLVSSYILFLARYFLICDDRQVDVMKKLLPLEIESNETKRLSTQNIYQAVLKTLNENEREVADTLFFTGVAPLLCPDNAKQSKVLTDYSFVVFKQGMELRTIFNMSAGPDIVLLPLTVGIFYEFIVSRLRDKSKKELINNIIMQLLASYEANDCRSITANIQLPNRILSENKIDVDNLTN